MKNILSSLSRHAIGAVGAILAWAATADVNAINDIFQNLQLIIGAVMTIGAAGGGIYSAIKAKQAKRQTAISSAALGVPVVKSSAGKTDTAETDKAQENAFFARSGS